MTVLAAEMASIAPDADRWFAAVGEGLRAGRLAPYLGPGLLACEDAAGVPCSHEALAGFFASKVALPKRARGNPWAAAQYIESNRHRSTLTQLMKAAFAPEVKPSALHEALGRWKPPLIVDSWYDATLRAALGPSTGWAELQGITRAGIGEFRWFRAYDSAGLEVDEAAAAGADSILYKPHGAVQPAANFLVTDADYVEVLTEIDIQTPIPQTVRDRRRDLGFVFIGCRFNDQLLRSYARQILKRSKGPYFALFAQDDLTRMERKFMAELHIDALHHPLSDAIRRIVNR